MRNVLLTLFVLIFFSHCKSKKEETNGRLETSKIPAIENNEAEKSVQNDDCFDLFFNQFIEGFKVEKSVSSKITRQGTLDCFVRNNSTLFEKLEKELRYTISNATDFGQPIRVKKLVFPNSELANQIFDGYARGFYNKCIGLKEPNFILIEENMIYIFFVSAESYRSALVTFKEKLLSGGVLDKCSSLRLSECR